MDDLQLPSGGGWFFAWLAAAAFIGRALETPLAWLFGLVGWHRSREAKRIKEADDRLGERIVVIVKEKVDLEMSSIRQNISAMQKGVDGKQAVLEDRLASLFTEVRDRDEQLAEQLHARISTVGKELEERVVKHFDRQIDLLLRTLNGNSRSSR